MPIVQNLKDLLHRHGNNGSPTSSSSSSNNPSQTSPTSSRHREHGHSKGKSSGSSAVPASQRSPVRDRADMQQQPLPAPPAAAQQAQFAAYNPEPATRSQADHFAGANPAAASPSDGKQQQPGQPSPSALTLGGGAVAQHGEAAQQMIEKAKAAKAKLPVYEGLPDHFVLIEKMGECARLSSLSLRKGG